MIELELDTVLHYTDMKGGEFDFAHCINQPKYKEEEYHTTQYIIIIVQVLTILPASLIIPFPRACQMAGTVMTQSKSVALRCVPV